MASFRNPRSALTHQAGFSLIELMIALVLGLLVVAGASAVFLSNKRTFGTSETLNRIQESQRASFELMSRDLREAGGNPCSMSSKPVNMLNAGGNTWWSSYGDGIRGYGGSDAAAGTTTGAATGNRVAGTDAVDLALANEGGDVRVVLQDTPGANIQVSSTAGITDGEILMICNMDYRMIFQVTNLTSAAGGFSIQHNGGGGGTTGNCSQVFQIFNNVSSCNPGASGSGYCFAVPDPTHVNPNCNDFSNSPARVAHVTMSRWYIGRNARGSTSLYRAVVVNNSGTNTPSAVNPTEIAEGATAMAVTYLRQGQASFETPAAITTANAWGQVIAARVSVSFGGVDGALTGNYLRGTNANGSAGAVINQTMTSVVTLRNRAGLI
ncbi:type IV pilus assembly protein PilW [Lysobacter sp. HA18]